VAKLGKKESSAVGPIGLGDVIAVEKGDSREEKLLDGTEVGKSLGL